MSEWADSAADSADVSQVMTGADDSSPFPDAGADTTAVDTGATPQVAGLQAQLGQMQAQMQAMQQMHSQQMQGIYGAMRTNPAQQPPAPPPSPSYKDIPALAGLDEDDPYFDQFRSMADHFGNQSASIESENASLRQQLQEVTLSQSRSSVQGQVDGALEKHKVPSEMSDDIRATVYAYMSSAPQGQSVSADAIVARYMQNLGKFAEVARTKWANEAKKPKPFNVTTASAGIQEGTPKTWDEARERSQAMMKAMLANN